MPARADEPPHRRLSRTIVDAVTSVDPRERFAGMASTYARYRPSYPAPLVDWVLAEARVRPGEYRRGEAASTGLEDASVELITAAQAFHWFDVDGALAEFHRILKAGGHVAAVWNIRGASPFMADYQAVLRRFSAEYSVIESWEETLARLRAHPRVEAPGEREVPNAQVFDLDDLRGRKWSSSYVRHGVADHEGFDAALRALFETHARGGVVEFPYRTVALVFGVRATPTA